jgi:agmatine/peptidylarginine deiminase
MIPDWQTNKIYFSELLSSRFPVVWNEIIEILNPIDGIVELLPKTKDIWARDYMPIQVSDIKYIEYRYDPDYLQGDSDEKETRELKTYPDIVCDTIGLSTKKSDIILDGGNLVKSSDCIILTDKIVWENRRTYSKNNLIKILHETFEVNKVILIPWDEECEFGHADGMLRFINDETVLVSGFYEIADEKLKKKIITFLKKANLNIEWLRCSPKKEKDQNIAYINFLQTKDLIIVPRIKAPEDDIAFEQISKFYSQYAMSNRIKQVDMSEIVKLGGALNCISWTIKTDE